MHTKELFNIAGQLALVTGGSRGLGLQLAEGLGEMGARMVITARTEKDLNEADDHLKKLEIEVLPIVNDLTDFDSIPGLVEQIVTTLGPIDILVNNAGMAIPAPAESCSQKDWKAVMDLNINGMFFLTQEVAKRCMIPRKRGKIINISSVGGLYGNPPDMPVASYNASKGADLGLTRGLCTEWGKHNINVNAICPGFFHTKMSEEFIEQNKKMLINKSPLRRLGGADDLKGVVVFLASEASKHITGEHFVVDGGSAITTYGPLTDA